MASSDRGLTPARVRAARTVAIAADLFQIVLLPAFAPGAVSLANDVLDVAVALLMFVLIGWHWAFLPTFLAELVPFFDLVPTWTAAVFFATRGAGSPRAAGGRGPHGAGPVIDTEVVSSAPGPKEESSGSSVM